MSFEDFSQYTGSEYIYVDSGGYLSVPTGNVNRIDFTNIPRQSDSYVYKDLGTGNLLQDYEILFDFEITDANGNITEVVLFQANNSPSANYLPGNGLNLDILTTGTGTTGTFKLGVYQPPGDIDVSISLNFETKYYIRVGRISGQFYAEIYANSTDRANKVNSIDIIAPGGVGDSTSWQYIQPIAGRGQSGTHNVTGYIENFTIVSSDLILADSVTLSDEIELNLSQEKIELEDTVTLSDEIELNLSLEKIILEDTVTLSDEISFNQQLNLNLEDTVTLSDSIYTDISQIYEDNLEDTISLSDEIEIGFITAKDIDNDFRMSLIQRIDIDSKFNSAIQELEDINSKFNMVIEELVDVNSKINTVREELPDVRNAVHFSEGKLLDLDNDFRSRVGSSEDINNDFRMSLSWQKAGDAGPQSLGKEYIKVYIDSVEQTDIDVNSINFTENINSSHVASIILGRPYDVNKPSTDSIVEIKYNDIRLFRGYIISVNPTDRPEHIRIECQDKYWERNRTKVWFNVGHAPTGEKEKYYHTIVEGLSSIGSSFGNIGNFIPQTINLFGMGESDAISRMVTTSGNFGWFYDKNWIKRLWTGGGGNVVGLESQELGKNLRLYQVLNHNLSTSIEGLINKYRVQMGDEVIRRFGSSGETTTFVDRWLSVQRVTARPAWETSNEFLAKNTEAGFGWDYHPDGSSYGDVFKKFKFPRPAVVGEDWTDKFRPVIEITRPFGGASVPSGDDSGLLKEGFSVDYESGILTLSEPFYYYDKNSSGQVTRISAPHVTLILYKQKSVTRTETTADNPQNDITNDLMFFTVKRGDYPITVQGNLNLGGMSIQQGGTYVTINAEGDKEYSYVPSWNDINFAKDIANWKLSQTAYPKEKGTITITLDALLYYNIDLSKRINVEGITSSPLNITSINYNMNSFTVTLNVENFSYFRRSTSRPSHGEGMSSVIVRSTSS